MSKTDRQSIQWGQLHMRAHGQYIQSKHAFGTVPHAGTWAGQTGKARIGDSYTCRHMGLGRQAKWAVGTETQKATGEGPIGREAIGTDTRVGPREGQAWNCKQNR